MKKALIIGGAVVAVGGIAVLVMALVKANKAVTELKDAAKEAEENSESTTMANVLDAVATNTQATDDGEVPQGGPAPDSFEEQRT